jgi:hypothetical protein
MMMMMMMMMMIIISPFDQLGLWARTLQGCKTYSHQPQSSKATHFPPLRLGSSFSCFAPTATNRTVYAEHVVFRPCGRM